jgi:hypothetical protein
MKKLSLIFLGSVLLIALCSAGIALAAPQQGLLVDENGAPLEGFSNVWIENGVAYPVYNSTTHLWYSVFIIGTGQNGVVTCTIGAPLGTSGDFNDGNGNERNDVMPDTDISPDDSTNPV